MGDKLNQDLKRILQAEDCPHQADFVPTAADALKRCEASLGRDNPYDLIFIEYLLDGANGIRLARSLKALDRNVLLVLLPTFFLNLDEVRNEYRQFGGFFLEIDFMVKNYRQALDLAVEYKLKQLELDSYNERLAKQQAEVNDVR